MWQGPARSVGLMIDTNALQQLEPAIVMPVICGLTCTHTSDVAVRFQEHVIPFFSRTLSFEPVKR